MADDPEFAASEIRVSNQDRDRTIERLRQHTTDGSLTLDEFADRVGVALSARTRGDLQALVTDLPVIAAPETHRTKARRWAVAVMSGSRLRGRWRAGRSIAAVAVMGGCEVDLRQADIAADEVRVTAVAVMGAVEIIVPEGIAVELSGIPIMGGKHMKIADVPVLPGSPLISVRAYPIMGGVSVRSKPVERKGDPSVKRIGSSGPPIELSAATPVMAKDTSTENPTAPDGTVTIMFSDIAGYSAITERLGDLATHDLLRSHNAIVREQLAGHGGREVKSQGDGFMVAFPSATRALRCAIAIQQVFEKYRVEHPDEPVRVHLGLDTGEPIRDGDDLLGRTVILASRLTSVAAPEEILVSWLVHHLTEFTGEFRFGDPRPVELKGFTGVQTAYPVDWRN